MEWTKALVRVAANGAPRVARSPLPWQVRLGEHHVGLFADRTRLSALFMAVETKTGD